VTSGREQVSAGTATPEQATALEVEVGDPVLLTRTWYFIEDGTPIKYGEGACPAGGGYPTTSL
jgi:DNA-binding GntR family transcriptional regulator